jgi:hypothetical protein
MAVVWMFIPEQERRRAVPEFLLPFMIIVGLHWYFMGALMIGESPNLSSRVKRQLPQSFFGRVFLTWFYPGPCTGYALALCGLFCGLLTAGIIMAVANHAGMMTSSWWKTGAIEVLSTFGILGLSYITIYLGLGLLLMRALRRVTQTGLVLSILLQNFLLLFGCFVPLIVQWNSTALRYSSYSLLHATNPFWTLVEICNRTSLPLQTPYLLIIVPMTAAAVFLLNLPGLIREIRNVRIVKPQRVTEDDSKKAKYIELI